MVAAPARHYPLPGATHRTVAHALDAIAASATPPVLRDPAETVTAADLASDATRVAGGIAALGMRAGDAVLTLMDNHADHVRLWFGLAVGGFVSVPVNTAAKGQALQTILHDSRARLLVCEARHLPTVRQVLYGVPGLTRIVVRGDDDGDRNGDRTDVTYLPWEVLLNGGTPAAASQVRPWDTQAIMYTSGSTGGPKGVIVPHALTYTRAAVVDQRVDADHLAALVSLPLFHVAGQCRGVLGPLLQGVDSVVLPRFSVSGFWRDIRTYRASSALLMGTMASYLLAAAPHDGDRNHSLQLAIMAPITERAGEFADRFGTRILASYGSTEAGTISSGETTVPGSLGWVHPDFEARVADEHDFEVEDGAVGELLVRGRHPWTMTPGYTGNPEASHGLWRNQWLHTGDLVSRGATGELIFAARSKEIIRRGGENISPSDVERAARDISGVLDCVALGVPSPDGEEDVKLVVIGDALDPSDLHRLLADALPKFMVPRFIELTDAFPRTPTEKLDKPAMRSTEGPGIWAAV